MNKIILQALVALTLFACTVNVDTVNVENPVTKEDLSSSSLVRSSSSSAAVWSSTSNGSSSGSDSGSDNISSSREQSSSSKKLSSSSMADQSSSSIAISSSSSVKTPFDDIKFWVGTGSKKAMLVIQWNDGRTPDALVWGYRWDGTKSGYNMISEIAKEDKRLFLLTYDEVMLGKAIAGIGYNFSGEAKIRKGEECEELPDGEIETDGYDFDDWELCEGSDARWQAGWYEGYWSYWLWETNGYDKNYPGSNKFYYSQRGASNRPLTDGARDVWYWSGGFTLKDSDISDQGLLLDFVPAGK